MSKKAWILSVDMGYGHQRTAYPLRKLGVGGQIISANNYKGMPHKDKKIWKESRVFYEFISRFKKVPIIGEFLFYIYNLFQKITDFYPKRDMSQAGIVEKQIYALFNKDWGKHLIKKLSLNPVPIVTTFFNVAFMAEHFGYPGDIYCVICDTDIARGWAPLHPQTSRIKYFASTHRSYERLKLYGVREKNIFLTGYPLPEENVKSSKKDLKNRLINLDPKREYYKKYKSLVDKKAGKLPKNSSHVLTIMFAVGGAGAQKEIGVSIVNGLEEELQKGNVRMFLVSGTREKVRNYFKEETKGIKNIKIISGKDFEEYYRNFNKALKETDVLWTKPSELSFYSALGLPIIIAPEIGSQEKFNKRWLLNSGFGISQKNPSNVSDWLFDWLNKGYLAEIAMEGFVEGERNGVKKIKKIIEK